MNLDDLRNTKKTAAATRVLKENYSMRLDLSALNYVQTSKMLKKVNALIAETRNSVRGHSSHKDPKYMQLLMMEQALSGHLVDMRRRTRIVVENEEVQKSQVILAAQDMIDSLQKMLEQISKMNVEELPAVVDGISNEIGSNESEQFNSSVGTALNTLQQALSTAKQEVSGALGTITGGATPEAPMPGGEESGMPELPGGEESGEEGGMPEMPELPEEPATEPKNLGRERR